MIGGHKQTFSLDTLVAIVVKTPFWPFPPHFLDTLKYFKTFKKKVILLQPIANMSVKHLGVMGTQTDINYGYNGSNRYQSTIFAFFPFFGHPVVFLNELL